MKLNEGDVLLLQPTIALAALRKPTR